MFFGRKFPYSNMHDLNLDWIIDEIKKIEGSMDWEQYPGRIEKVINDANGDPLYKFMADDTGVYFVHNLDEDTYLIGYDIASKTFHLYDNGRIVTPAITAGSANITSATINGGNITAQIGAFNSIGATSATLNNLEANLRMYFRRQNASNAWVRAGVVEVVYNEPRMQFWVQTDLTNPNGIEHYRLPAATATTPTYYDILTTKDDTVTDQSVTLESGVEGTIVCHKYRHVLQVKVAGIHDPNYASWKTIATLPTGYRPAESLYIPLYEVNTSTTAWAYIGTNGTVQLVGGSSSASLYGSFTYIV